MSGEGDSDTICPAATRVFVDANILFSKTLMDRTFFLREHTGDMFQLHSTEDVIAEALARLRDKNPRLSGGLITHAQSSSDALSMNWSTSFRRIFLSRVRTRATITYTQPPRHAAPTSS